MPREKRIEKEQKHFALTYNFTGIELIWQMYSLASSKVRLVKVDSS